jgi:hypothetical protein
MSKFVLALLKRSDPEAGTKTMAYKGKSIRLLRARDKNMKAVLYL